jgi:hypothetical protein
VEKVVLDDEELYFANKVLGVSDASKTELPVRLEHLRSMYQGRLLKPMPAHLRAEIEAVQSAAKSLSAKLAHLPTDAQFAQPIPSITSDASFEIWQGTLDFDALRDLLLQLVSNCDVAIDRVNARGRSDAPAFRQKVAAMKADTSLALSNLFDMLAITQGRPRQKGRREFIHWAFEIVSTPAPRAKIPAVRRRPVSH